jgi:hypothetical protein
MDEKSTPKQSNLHDSLCNPLRKILSWYAFFSQGKVETDEE